MLALAARVEPAVTLEASVLVGVGALLELLKDHPPIPCGDEQAHKDGSRPMLESQLGVIDQCRGGGIDAAVYVCLCGWRDERRLRPNKGVG